jgi:hypothetical protein
MRTKRRRRVALTAAALLAATAGSGCMTVQPAAVTAQNGGNGTTGFSYLGGRATQTFAPGPAAVQPAVLAAMDDLRMTAVRQTKEPGSLVLEGTTADNRRAAVTIHPQPGGATRLTTRIGLFGDEPLSRALMDRVAIRLGALPPSAIPVEPPSSPGANPFFSRSAVSDAVMLKDQADAPYRPSGIP